MKKQYMVPQLEKHKFQLYNTRLCNTGASGDIDLGDDNGVIDMNDLL